MDTQTPPGTVQMDTPVGGTDTHKHSCGQARQTEPAMCSQQTGLWNTPHPTQHLYSACRSPCLCTGAYLMGCFNNRGISTRPPLPPLETVWIFVKNCLWVPFLYKTWGQPSHSPTPGCHPTACGVSYSESKPIPMFPLQSILYALPFNYSLEKVSRIPEMFLCPGTVQ